MATVVLRTQYLVPMTKYTFNENISSLCAQFTGKYSENFDGKSFKLFKWNFYKFNSYYWWITFYSCDLKYFHVFIFSNIRTGIPTLQKKRVNYQGELANKKGWWLLGCELVIIKYFDILFIYGIYHLRIAKLLLVQKINRPWWLNI